MSIQLRINRGSESVAIDVSFIRQFLLPVCILIVLIIERSILLETTGFSSRTVYSKHSPVSVATVSRLQRQIADLEWEG